MNWTVLTLLLLLHVVYCQAKNETLRDKLDVCSVFSLDELPCEEIFEVFGGYGKEVEMALKCFSYNKFIDPYVSLSP